MPREIKIKNTWPEWKKRLAEAVNERGWNMREASTNAGLGATFLRDTLIRESEPTFRSMNKMAESLGVDISQLSGSAQQNTPHQITYLKVLGTVQAGVFMESYAFEDFGEDAETIAVAEDSRFVGVPQYALRVAGNSMDRVFPPGSYVTCVSWPDCGLSQRAGMILHVCRVRGGLVEATVKRLVQSGRDWLLSPDSTDPAHKPIPIDGEDGDEIIIKGLVTGTWSPVSY